MGQLTLPHTIIAGEEIIATEHQANYEAIRDVINGNIDTENIDSGVLEDLGVSDSTSTRRGKAIIAAEESTGSASYTTLTTPDRVSSIVLPSDGLLFVAYSALWKASVAGAGRAALFVGTDQISVPEVSTSPTLQEVSGLAAAGQYRWLATAAYGLTTGDAAVAADSTDVATPIVLADGSGVGGIALIRASAGTYNVSVQFKATSGTVSAKSRKLWVWTMGF
jgi:hypothetical protein